MTVKETLISAWHLPELRARIIFVFAMFAVYALGLHVSVPGLSQAAVERIVTNSPIFQMLDVFGGGALRKVSIFALGLNPYITGSIIMQLMGVAIPKLQQLQKEGGEYGRRQINGYTRRLTVVLAVLQALGIVISFRAAAGPELTTVGLIIIVISWTAGAMFLLWLGEQMTEKGIGNGISLLIFAGIVASLPNSLFQTAEFVRVGAINPAGIFGMIAIFLATIWGIVMFTRAQRRIPIQHARRIIGSRTVGGQTTYLPISVNTAGVIPIIFAISLVLLPQQFAAMTPPGNPLHGTMTTVANWLTPGNTGFAGIVASLVYGVLIFFFTYFYTAVIYNVEDMADNLKKHGAYIPSIRPGKATQQYLDHVISRVTVAGALFLSVIALLQYYVPTITGVSTFGLIGGTSLLIVVGVALDTMQQIETQLLMRQYEGFIR